MGSRFLSNLIEVFGLGFNDNPRIREALTQDEDLNRSLAIIGDSVLNLVVNNIAYHHDKEPEAMDLLRKQLAGKKANQRCLNRDVEFTRYLVGNGFTRSPIGGIGLEKADRFFEAIIGAVYLEHDFGVAEEFVINIIRD